MQGGKKFLSAEFHSRCVESRSAGGIREIESALLAGVALVSSSPEYKQATAEIRTKSRGG